VNARYGSLPTGTSSRMNPDKARLRHAGNCQNPANPPDSMQSGEIGAGSRLRERSSRRH
jgi:hypothetical protein